MTSSTKGVGGDREHMIFNDKWLGKDWLTSMKERGGVGVKRDLSNNQHASKYGF